ncbi:PTS mannose transporter subunit IIAB [Sporolactobacillus shoreae]|uniref:PTS mannose transporter subunit IIAB n=1 Tax=Sporolactobacillus shoreae TaxID=1465501 RepID=A0A4Z0GTK7_9BACL|nr:fructose PTS transporter subunit IIA [Sporolactobacillus shoreae]TGA99883.1 PTS mannose transporter subunit IIAB [Sporolactobacillus shoreae]
MQIIDLISQKNIVMNLDAKTEQEAIKKLSIKLFENDYINNAGGFYDDVLERESYTTTGIGNGIAIPHGKSDYVNESTVIFAKTTEGIEWNSLDGSKVRIIFLMAVNPRDKGKEHLQALAKIASRLMDDHFVRAIKEANTTEEVIQILSK